MDVAHLRFYFGEGAKATMGEGYWVYIKTGDRRQTCADSDSSSVRPKDLGAYSYFLLEHPVFSSIFVYTKIQHFGNHPFY